MPFLLRAIAKEACRKFNGSRVCRESVGTYVPRRGKLFTRLRSDRLVGSSKRSLSTQHMTQPARPLSISAPQFAGADQKDHLQAQSK